ncbi:hypothetical protein N7530_006317 [Penicillium desertorum]|uniref:Uncharacterized protein n=1 Tax=Penicillium desertorum TaxID=1303715 RepID=A0A9W9WRQ6_9EURO|nr:hypothetical protein N7530_006317 [Penicillium desertorum]
MDRARHHTDLCLGRDGFEQKWAVENDAQMEGSPIKNPLGCGSTEIFWSKYGGSQYRMSPTMLSRRAIFSV